jgi:hypothetical protein
MSMRLLIAICFCAWLAACVSHSAQSAAGPGLTSAPFEQMPTQASPSGDPEAHDDSGALAAIRAVHGGAGPWVVAGYRMGRYALSKLGLKHGSFDLEVTHHSPREVQYSCIADGAAAATGASLGRLSLSLEPAVASETRTTYRNRRTGATITLATTPEFAHSYADVPRPQLTTAGELVLQLPDAAIFSELPTP